jgi:acyl-CoA thioester hydrolase
MDMVVARAEVDFLDPIYEGGFDLDVEIWVTKIGNASFDLAYQMSSKGTIFANAKTVQVAVSMETKKSRPLSDIEREYLGRYLEA